MYAPTTGIQLRRRQAPRLHLRHGRLAYIIVLSHSAYHFQRYNCLYSLLATLYDNSCDTGANIILMRKMKTRQLHLGRRHCRSHGQRSTRRVYHRRRERRSERAAYNCCGRYEEDGIDSVIASAKPSLAKTISRYPSSKGSRQHETRPGVYQFGNGPVKACTLSNRSTF